MARVSRSGRIRPTNRLAYVEPILRSSFSYRFPTISVRIVDRGGREDADRHDRLRLQPAPLCPGAPVRPGRAATTTAGSTWSIFRDPGPFQALYYLWKVFRGTHLDDPERVPSPGQARWS